MYVPKHFEEPDADVMRALMRAHPLATIITSGLGGLCANHIPLLVDPVPTPYGRLLGHVARANSMWREVDESQEVLAIFQGPDAYISPNWYATKRENGKVVPTWNYAVVHAYGHMHVHDDQEWTRGQIEQLTAEHEALMSAPWSVSDAPTEYVEKLIQAIVGIEIVLTKLVGKWKVSQNQPLENRAGVVAGLESRQSTEMANLVEAASQRVRFESPPEN
jgi:transcriptional regulator